MSTNQPEAASNLYHQVSRLLEAARQRAVQAVNHAMVATYFEIGRLIVEEEQAGKHRGEYGEGLIETLATQLTAQYGRGFSDTNLRQMRNFYLAYQKRQTLSAEFRLGWSHYLKLMRISNPDERAFYEIEAAANSWSLRELKRQYDSGLYARLALSRDAEGVKRLAQKGQTVESPQDIIKDPYVLEFLGLEEQPSYSEHELETSLIDRLQHFLLELGKGFAFIGRQQRITIEEKHFRTDLVFYNRLLRAFVLIDLKLGELTHEDLGQMQMYVNYYDRSVKLPDENPTVGIVLCQDKSDTLVEMTLPAGNAQIFASRYLTVLPTKEELRRLLNGR